MSTNILLTGQQFCATIPTNATSIVFCDETAPTGVSLTDVSEAQDNGVIAWLDGTTYKVSTQGNAKVLANPNSASMFLAQPNLTYIDFGNLDTSHAETMATMFYKSYNLTELDLSNFDTSKVTNMQGMFGGYGTPTKFKTLDLSSFDTSNVTNMYLMFHECKDLKSIKFGKNFKTDNVKNMTGMFKGCKSLTSLDLSSFNTGNVTAINGMFIDCHGLTSLDLSNFDTSNAINMSGMFEFCPNLKTINLGGKFSTESATNISGMFNGCESLTSIDLSNFDTKNNTDIRNMFRGCKNLKNIKFEDNFVTDNVKNMYGVFCNCENLTELDISEWDTSSCTEMGWMFQGCKKLKTLDLSKWDLSKVTSTYAMFQNCYELENFSVKNWKTGSVEDMSFMWYGCSSFKTIDFEDWDVSNVRTFDHFMAHSHMEEYDVSKWQVTNKCENLNAIFHSTRETYIDVTGWDVSNCKVFSQMCDGMPNLERIDGLNTWDTSSCVCFDEMFLACLSLKELDLSSFDTRNVDEHSQVSANGSISLALRSMFGGCNSLEKLILGENFTRFGNENISESNYAVLPTSASGYWYTMDGVVYAPADVPNLTAGSYYASEELARQAYLEYCGSRYMSLNSMVMFHDRHNAEISAKLDELQLEANAFEEITDEEILALFI